MRVVILNDGLEALMANDLIPIGDEQAKAIQEVAKVGGKGLDIVSGVGGYLGRVLGVPIEDLVGILGADWLNVRRAENLARMLRASAARLEARHVEDVEAAPLSIAAPVLKAAGDEDRGELVDLWARLLAAAMDPDRRGQVRRSFIGTLERMDPLDALVLEALWDLDFDPGSSMRDRIADELGKEAYEVDLSFQNLMELDCIYIRGEDPGIKVASIRDAELSVKGRSLRMLLAD